MFSGHVAWLAVERCTGSDGGERKQLSLNPVRSHGWPALDSVATTLKQHKMEDFYVTEVDMK